MMISHGRVRESLCYSLVPQQEIVHCAGEEHNAGQVDCAGGQNGTYRSDGYALLGVSQVARSIGSSHDA